MRLCISLGRLSVSWRAAGVPYLIRPHLSQPLSGPAWRKNRGSSLRREGSSLSTASRQLRRPRSGRRRADAQRETLPGRATASCTTRAPPPYDPCWSRPSHRWASSRAGADRWTWSPARLTVSRGRGLADRRRHRYGPPDPGDHPDGSRPRSPSSENAWLSETRPLPSSPRSRNSPSRAWPHSTTRSGVYQRSPPARRQPWNGPVRIVQLSLTSPDRSSTAREPVGVACGVPSP